MNQNKKEQVLEILRYWKLVDFLNQPDIKIDFLNKVNNDKCSEFGKIYRDKQLKLSTEGRYYISIWKISRNDILKYLVNKYGEKIGINDINSILSELMYNENQFVAGCSFEIMYDHESNDFIYVKNTFKLSPILWYLKIYESESNENDKCYYFIKKLKELFNLESNNSNFTQINDYVELYKRELKCINDAIVKHNLDVKSILDLCINFEFDKYSDNSSIIEKNNDIGYYKLLSQNEIINEMGFSFFSSELDMIEKEIDSLNKGNKYDQSLLAYITCLLDNEELKKKRINISPFVETEDEKNEIKKIFDEYLSLDKAPIGKWPSKFNPALMQQLAINLSIDFNNPIMSVNGPPGTGKTTLLKEIVADFIVKRASVLCKLNNVSDLFEKKECSNNSEISYYAIKEEYLKEIKKYNILVASSNNNAVENITKELPEGKDIFQESINYFRNEEGLEDLKINVDYFQKQVNELFDVKNDDYWGVISAPLGKINNIDKYQTFLRSVINQIKNNNQENVELNSQGYKNDFLEIKNKFNEKMKEVIELRNIIMDIKKINSGINKDIISDLEYKKIKDLIDDKKIDDIFYDKYFNKEKEAQLFNPWITDQYNRLRIELFLLAIEVHKSFILSSNEISTNLDYYIKKEIISRYGKEIMPSIIQCLFIVTPVISTTFASVCSFLKYIGKGELGTLIIDEAGQAEPHMALGALYRCSKAIVVGDPKQIEPVVTSESNMFKRIFNNKNVKKYQNQNCSVQSFADCINPYGRYLKNDWVGCPLIVHRRCADPMFTISNELCYGESMINGLQGVKEEKQLICNNSYWVNINGNENGNKSHYVQKQGDIVIKMIKLKLKKIDSKNVYDINDLYIISPFKSVVQDFKAELLENFNYNSKKETDKNKMVLWMNNYIGTVHTFQGKGTNEVILLLGCDKNSIGAVKWVNQNLINVAVTRAKKQIYIVGDYELWKKCEPINNISKIIDDYLTIQCPMCGNLMVKRINSNSKIEFLGCTNFPKCNCSKNLEEIK